MIRQLLITLIIPMLCLSCGNQAKKDSGAGPEGSVFSVRENDQGLELLENGEPVFFYQREPKSGDGVHYFNNYLHPLYNLSGDTITEEFPADHFHHRGIFWAWHQHYMGDQNLGDQWFMEGISQVVEKVETELEADRAIINTEVSWHSSLMEPDLPYMKENTIITVLSRTDSTRIIDFEISLSPLLPDLRIGGSDDDKGYGGFCTRIIMPEDLVFTSDSGVVIPQRLQISAGPWMDFSGSLGVNSGINGITLICHPDTPNYPATWILRQKGSMQNIVWPAGLEVINMPMGKSTVLKYRLIIHKGGIPVQATL